MTPEELQTDEAAVKKLTEMDGLRRRLFDVTGLLVIQVPTTLRAVLERYYPMMRKSLAPGGSSQFPKACVRQKRDNTRTLARLKGDILLFHVGNAILAYYADDAKLMENQVQLLEDIVMLGYRTCVVIGSDAKGFALATEPEAIPEVKPHVRVPAPKK